MMDRDFDYNKLPNGWALCYLTECSRKEECMRYQACLSVPYTRNQCVLPTVLRKVKCPYFHPIRKVRVTKGFRHIFKDVKERNHSAMRSRIANYLGRGGTYYRYRNGEKPLMPKQQEWIPQLFHRYGYTDEVVFDSHETVYDIKN